MRQGRRFSHCKEGRLSLQKIGAVIRMEGGDHRSHNDHNDYNDYNDNRSHHDHRSHNDYNDHNSARIETYFAHQNIAQLQL